MKNLNKYIDHTLLRPDATKDDLKKLCKEAIEYDFYSVCINPSRVHFARELLKGSPIKVCSVLDFPLGSAQSYSKVLAAEQLLETGVDEIDMVINIGAFKDGNYKLVGDEITSIVNRSHPQGVILKIIIETCLLTKEEIVKACHIGMEAQVDFIKTSTGFSSGGALIEDIRLIQETVGKDIGIKASGGISDYHTALAMIEAGASRIGASRSVNILKEYKSL